MLIIFENENNGETGTKIIIDPSSSFSKHYLKYLSTANDPN